MDLVDHVFKETIKNGEAKEDILAMMEDYGLIAKFGRVEDSENLHYFVPAQLKSSPEGLLDVEPSPSSDGPCALYFHFLDGFIPHGLYNCLVSKLIAWCSFNGYTHKPKLFRSVSHHFIGGCSQYELFLICRKRFVKVVLMSLPSEQSLDIKPAFSVRDFLENCLKEMTDQCHWYRFSRYEISVLCPPCSEKKCPKHGCHKCCIDDCLHLLSVPNDGVLVCEESCGKDSKPKVPGLQEWYREPPTVSLYY
jgi:hypothetical protein